MPQEKSPRILVVDDDDAIRAMVERVLRREKFEVESARDGFEAIQKLARHDYATVLLDLMMPRVDGNGVLQFLDTKPCEQKPQVIIMTANLSTAAESPHVDKVATVLPKPFDIRQLVAHVRQCVGPTTPASAASDVA